MYGLVLEGGGAKGAYQIGAIKALIEMGYEFSAITGTSIGAINGAFIVSGEFEKIYSIWEEAEINRLIKTDKELLSTVLDFKINSKNIIKVFDYILDTIENGGLDISPLKDLLRENIDEKKLRESKIDFGLVTVSLSDLEPIEIFVEDIPEGKIVDYIIASASLPIFKLEKVGGKSYIDGAFYDNMPINLVTRKDIKNIIVIETEGLGRKRKINKKDLNIIRIKPSKKISRTIEVDPKIMQKNLKIGYLDAYRKIKSLYGREYYIQCDLDENSIIEFFSRISYKKINKIAKVLNYKGKYNKKDLFEIFIPILGNLIKVGEKNSYIDFFIYWNELIAEYYEITCLKKYSYEEFTNLVKDSILGDSKIKDFKKLKFIPLKLLPKQFELLPKDIRVNILIRVLRIMYNNEE